MAKKSSPRTIKTPRGQFLDHPDFEAKVQQLLKGGLAGTGKPYEAAAVEAEFVWLAIGKLPGSAPGFVAGFFGPAGGEHVDKSGGRSLDSPKQASARGERSWSKQRGLSGSISMRHLNSMRLLEHRVVVKQRRTQKQISPKMQ